MIEIPAITLYDPWATWVARKLKGIETRTHCRFRRLVGKWIAIHAGLRFDSTAYAAATRYRGLAELEMRELHPGCVIALAHVDRFRELTAADSALALIDCGSVKRYGLFFDKVEPLGTPIQAVGHQGVWTWRVECENGIRDPDYPCGLFEYGQPAGECQGDGHYMCPECLCHIPDDEDRTAA